MSYLGNSPGVSSQRVVTEEVISGSAKSDFYPVGGYALGYVDVLINGIEVDASDFTAANGTLVHLNSPAQVGDTVKIKCFIPRGLSDGYTKAETDARHVLKSGDTMTGNLLLNAAGNTIDASNRIRSREGFRTTSNNGTNEYQTSGFYDGSAYQIVHSTDNFVTHALRLGIDSAGRVTIPSQPVFATQGMTGNVTLSATPVKLPFGSAYINRGSGYSNAQYTAPVTGVYDIESFVLIISGSVSTPQNVTLHVYQNGSNTGITGRTKSVQEDYAAVSGKVYLQANDTVSIYASTDAAGLLYQSFCGFNGHLIG